MSESSFHIIGDQIASDFDLMKLNEKVREVKANVGITFDEHDLNLLCALTDPTNQKVHIDNILEENMRIIDEFYSNGYCYTTLFALLPSLVSANPNKVREMMRTVTLDLGVEPDGKRIIEKLPLSEIALRTSGEYARLYHSVNFLFKPDFSPFEIENIYRNEKVRFSYTDNNGLLHLKKETHTCLHTEVMCDHGWSPRFILSLVARPDCKVGSESVDYSELFGQLQDQLSSGEDDSDFETSFDTKSGIGQTLPLNIRTAASKIKSNEEIGLGASIEHTKMRNNAMRRGSDALEKELSKDMAGIVSEQLEKRTKMLEKILVELSAEAQRRKETEIGGKFVADYAEDVVSTILPNDSSTVVERYTNGRRFMPKCYSVGPGKTKTEKLDLNALVPVVADVVNGFCKTDSLVQSERESIKRVYQINGLAAPFKNGRLNLLMHIHTALSECSFDPTLDPIDAMEELGSARPRNPTGELARQVVNRTFNFEQMLVIANPFNLPFLEIGMNLTDSVVVKSLELLGLEYKTLWFDELKCLRVPSFHADYNGLSTDIFRSTARGNKARGHRAKDRSQSSKTNHEDYVQQTGTPSTTRSRRRRGSTILGLNF